MCGIIGFNSKKPNVVEILLKGLKALEYRGYDSAGIGIINKGVLEIHRAVGKIKFLEQKLSAMDLSAAQIGIAHTRWATHGEVNVANAHPQFNSNIAVVHNGIVENFQELRNDLQNKGYFFNSDTDTEVIVHLLEESLKNGLQPLQAVFALRQQLVGAYGLAIIFAKNPDVIFALRCGSPLIVGRGNNNSAIASDSKAISTWCQQVAQLSDGDLAVLASGSVTFYDDQGQKIEKSWRDVRASDQQPSKGTYKHYMAKEIFEQPQALKDTLKSWKTTNIDWQKIQNIQIIACGTSYYAGVLGQYWFEGLARKHTRVDIASEFRYRAPVIKDDTLVIYISQSGETSDTLACAHYLSHMDVETLAIVNVEESSLTNLSKHVIYTKAGVEIGVASTKAYSCQMLTLLKLALEASNRQLDFDPLWPTMQEVLEQDYESIANGLVHKKSVFFMGRGCVYPLALEGALKLQELSYIHATGYPGGELKHGPIALLEPGMPIIVLAPHDQLFAKTLSNIQEVLARGAELIVLSDKQGLEYLMHYDVKKIEIPYLPTLLETFLYIIPLQQIAYYTALLKGTDVDQPRNLAKSVTVE